MAAEKPALGETDGSTIETEKRDDRGLNDPITAFVLSALPWKTQILRWLVLATQNPVPAPRLTKPAASPFDEEVKQALPLGADFIARHFAVISRLRETATSPFVDGRLVVPTACEHLAHLTSAILDRIAPHLLVERGIPVSEPKESTAPAWETVASFLQKFPMQRILATADLEIARLTESPRRSLATVASEPTPLHHESPAPKRRRRRRPPPEFWQATAVELIKDGLSINEVARKAGVSRARLYRDEQTREAIDSRSESRKLARLATEEALRDRTKDPNSGRRSEGSVR